MNILGGLDVPSSGTVRYRDHNLTAADERGLTVSTRSCRLRLSVLQPYRSLTARENVELVTDIAAQPMPAAGTLGLVGLGSGSIIFPLNCPVASSSVSPSRAIAKRPEVLLCDEAHGALDISTGIVVAEAIERVNTDLGTTTAVITHNSAVAAMADRVISLADGRIVNEQRQAESVAEGLAMTRTPRKLVRDLWQTRGQGFAISLGLRPAWRCSSRIRTFDTLRLARQTYYDRLSLRRCVRPARGRRFVSATTLPAFPACTRHDARRRRRRARRSRLIRPTTGS